MTSITDHGDCLSLKKRVAKSITAFGIALVRFAKNFPPPPDEPRIFNPVINLPI